MKNEEPFVAEEEKKAKYYIHTKKNNAINPQDIRCRTFNVPKDFRTQFQDKIEEKKDEMKLATNAYKTSMIQEENEISESDLSNS